MLSETKSWNTAPSDTKRAVCAKREGSIAVRSGPLALGPGEAGRRERAERGGGRGLDM